MAVTSGNPKHVFDFEGILNMDIDPAHWKNVKKQLEDAFGNLKIAIQDGLAEEEAQKYIDQFNKIFRKAKLPEIGLDDLREDFAKLEVNVEKAVAAINNIELDRLDDMLHELKLINGEVEKILKNKGGIKLFDDDNLKKVMGDIERIANTVGKSVSPLLKSVEEIDEAIGRAKVSAKDVHSALNFEFSGKQKKKMSEELFDIYNEYNSVASNQDSSWEEQYVALTKFTKAYEIYISKLKEGEQIDPAYTKVYNDNKAGKVDRRNMLQNIINRSEGKGLVGYHKEPFALENTLQEIKSILQGDLSVKVGDGSTTSNNESNVKGAASGNNEDVVKALGDIKNVLSKGIVISRNDDPDGDRGTEKQIDVLIGSFLKEFKKLDGASSSYANDLDELANTMSERIEQMFPRRNLGYSVGDIGYAFTEYGADEDEKNLKSQIYDIVNKALPKVSAEIDFYDLEAILKRLIYKVQIVDGQEIKKEAKADSNKEVHVESAKQTVEIDSNTLTEALSKMQVTADNKDVVAELKNAENSLGKLVAQETTLKEIRDSLSRDTQAAITEHSLMPTVDGLEPATLAPSDEQKEYVLKLAEEYRAIMSVLERGDDTSADIANALRERAAAIRDVIQFVKASDSTPDGALKLHYGADDNVVQAIGNSSKQSSLYMHQFDVNKITDTSRQDAIDLIYKEIDAIKQLEAAKVAEKEAKTQRETDRFQAEYQSATDEQKKLVRELISLDQEFKKVYGSENNSRASEILNIIRNKTAELEIANEELASAFDDVGERRAAQYIDSLPVDSTDNQAVGLLGEISQKMDVIAKDETLNLLKESLSNITVTPDNSEIVSELKTLVQNLGNLAQEQTLQDLKNDGAKLTKEDIATAIRNGVATQEILGKYRPASFLDIFHYDTSDDTLDHVISALTGERLSKVIASQQFNEDLKGNYFVPRDISEWDLSPSDLITTEDALKNVLIEKAEKTENWAKVIVEAINTQGGQIIETIKLVLPQEITGGIDDTQLVNAFNVLTKAINDFGYGAKSFFSDVLGGNVPKETDVRGALEALGLISSSGKPTFKMPGIGGMNKGIAISDEVVYHTTRDSEIGNVYELMKKQNAAYEMGASVARIIAAHEGNGYAMSLQSRAPGKNFRDDAASTGVLEATDEQIDRLLYTFEVLEKNGLVIEFGGDNILFDKEKGFSLVDMTSDKIPGHWDDQVTAKDMLSSFLVSFRSIYTNTPEERNKLYNLQDRIQQRSHLSPEERLVNADTIAAEKARARVEAKQSKSQEITVTTDNSDVIEAINKLGNSLGVAVAQDDTLQAIRDNAVQLTKEDIVGAIKEGIPAPPEEAPDSDAPWALESTLNTTIKNILEKIQTNTAKLDGVEIRQAVDANAQATKQAASAVSEHMGNAATPADVDKIISKQKVDKDGKPTGPIAQTQIHTEKTDSSVRTVKDTFLVDGEETQHIFREVIDDLEKLRKANKKDAADVARAQKKVDEFVAKFESKTGGNARFVEGFEDIKGFTVDKTNIDEAYNKMIELQRKYAELETNFRKGQSSLNPFVNAINKAQNIGNIFGSVEIKFNGLVDKSEELTSQFAKLKDLSESIKQFTDRMVSDPDSITPADFTEFSKQMGEFTATKTQVDGMIKNESKLNKTVAKEQNDRIKEWLDLSKKLGTVQAKINSGIFDETVVEQAKKEAEILQRKIDEILPFINDPVQHLVPIGDANIASEDKAVKAEMSKRIGILVSQYEKLGQLQARAEKGGAITEREKYDQLKKEVEAETQTLRLNEQGNEILLRALQLHQETAYANEKDLTIAKDRQRLFNEWIELVKQISALDVQIESGLFDEVAVNNAKAARDNLSKHIDAILPQLDLTRDDYIFAGQESMKSEQSTIMAQRQKLFKELAGNYAKLGEAQAQVDIKQTDAAKERVAQLSREIASKKAILNLSQDELEILEAISNQSKAENSNMLSAKDRDKAARAELQAQKKLSRRQALVGKAGSAIGRADSVWLETTTLDPSVLPKEFLERVKEYEKKLDALKIKHNELSTSQGPVTKQQKNQLIAQTNAVNELTNELGSLVDEYQRMSGANALELGITDLNGKSSLEDYKKQLTSAVVAATNGKAQIKGFNWETKTLTYTVKTGAHEFTEYTAAVRGLDHQMVSLRGNTKRTETFLEATKRKMGEISSYMSGMALFSRASQEIRKGIQYVREIDLALTELKKVTNETDATYDKFLKTAAKTGAKLGSTISSVTEATATFAKLGYEMDMASEMAEAAIVYKNVGDNIASTEDAADSIISTMKGFRLEASESMAIVDRFNEVGEENCPSYIVIYG